MLSNNGLLYFSQCPASYWLPSVYTTTSSPTAIGVSVDVLLAHQFSELLSVQWGTHVSSVSKVDVKVFDSSHKTSRIHLKLTISNSLLVAETIRQTQNLPFQSIYVMGWEVLTNHQVYDSGLELIIASTFVVAVSSSSYNSLACPITFLKHLLWILSSFQTLFPLGCLS